MKVSEIMATDVAVCRPEDSDDRAAHLMWQKDCGALPVVDEGGRTIGMITDRDLCMAAYTRGTRLADLSVKDAMSREVFGCLRESSVDEALGVMREHCVRRLPVLDGERHVVGLLSINDVLRAVEHDRDQRERKALLEAVSKTLDAVCAHRHPAGDGAQAGRRAEAPPARVGVAGIRK